MLKSLISKISLTSIILLISVSGCNNIASTKNVITEEFIVKDNSHLNEDGTIVTGENYVFEYIKNEDPDTITSDNETSNSVLFEINKNDINSFSFKDDGLAKINLLDYHLACFLYEPRASVNKISTGSIEGKKNSDGSWKVNAKLLPFSFNGGTPSYTYTFSNTFKLKQ